MVYNINTWVIKGYCHRFSVYHGTTVTEPLSVYDSQTMSGVVYMKYTVQEEVKGRMFHVYKPMNGLTHLYPLHKRNTPETRIIVYMCIQYTPLVIWRYDWLQSVT